MYLLFWPISLYIIVICLFLCISFQDAVLVNPTWDSLFHFMDVFSQKYCLETLPIKHKSPLCVDYRSLLGVWNNLIVAPCGHWRNCGSHQQSSTNRCCLSSGLRGHDAITIWHTTMRQRRCRTRKLGTWKSNTKGRFIRDLFKQYFLVLRRKDFKNED